MPRHFASLFIPLALLVSIGGGLYMQQNKRATVEAISLREAALVDNQAEIFTAILASRAADAAFLAARITDELKADVPHVQSHIRDLLWAFARIKTGYLQVRYLDANGQENVRIDTTPDGFRLIADDALQDKSQTAYFKNASKLAAGHVTISRFDLNVEHGQVELPPKPVVRFSSPVFDSRGNRAGIVVLNLDGQVLLSRLRQAATAGLGSPLLLNDQGYWLLGPDEDQDWGFQLPDRPLATMASAWPGVWERIGSGEHGQFFHGGDLYSFSAVRVAAPGVSPSRTVLTPVESWVIVSQVPEELFDPPLSTTFVIMTIGLFVLMAGLSWLWAASRARREMIQSRLAESEAQFRAMSEASQDALVMLDDQGRIAYWNRAAERMFGRPQGVVMGQALHDLVAQPDDQDKSRIGLAEFRATGRGAVVNEVGEYVGRRGDGTTFPVELSVAAFRRDNRWWAVGSGRDISERKKAEEALVRLATTDGLTGLFNRRHFLELGAAELVRAARYGHAVSLIMFDVDHFKRINDSLGHDAGDVALSALADTAKGSVRTMDILGRLGGEEFAVLLPETGIETAVVAAERLRAAVAALRPMSDGVALKLTISLGVVQGLGPEETLDALLKRADEALYRAKATGRDRVERG